MLKTFFLLTTHTLQIKRSYTHACPCKPGLTLGSTSSFNFDYLLLYCRCNDTSLFSLSEEYPIARDNIHDDQYLKSTMVTQSSSHKVDSVQIILEYIPRRSYAPVDLATISQDLNQEDYSEAIPDTDP